MVFCTSCGNKCLDGARFCNGCGAQLLAPETPAPAPAPPTQTTEEAIPVFTRAAAPRIPRSEQQQSPRGNPNDMICPTCKRPAGDLLDKIVGTQHYHLDCFICNQCKVYLGEKRFFRDPREAGALLCAECKDAVVPTTRTAGERGYAVHRPVVNPTGTAGCRRCGKTVFENEKFRACESLWHRQCFTCESCGTRLDPRNYESIRETPYCKPCSQKIPK